jgi:anti-sigma regulatory factor (Ser/Thr protein kinase)
MSMQEATVQFQPAATAPAMGRRVLDALADEIPLSTLDDARLLLTELLTNAIQHGNLHQRDRISVMIRRESAGIHVEVVDPGDGFPPELEARSGTGWGLTLLDRLADEWGLEPRPDGGTIAWFRLAAR